MSTEVHWGDWLEDIDGGMKVSYGVVVDPLPDEHGHILVLWEDGLIDRYDPIYACGTTPAEVKIDDPESCARLEKQILKNLNFKGE